MALFNNIVKKILTENWNNYNTKAEFVNGDWKQGIYIYHVTPATRGMAKVNARRQHNGQGAGNLYGDGLYSTYTLGSAKLNSNYGGFSSDAGMMKMVCKSNLRQFIIFDPNVCKQVWGKDLNIFEQLSEIFKNNQDLLNKLKQSPTYASWGDGNVSFNDLNKYYRNAINYDSDSSNYTSVGAQALWTFIRETESRYNVNLRGRYIKGLIFSGRNDGNVVVCFDFGDLESVAVSKDNGKTFKPVDVNDWQHRAISDNVDLRNRLLYTYDSFRTEGFKDGYAVVRNRSKGYRILNQILFMKFYDRGGDGKIFKGWFDYVYGSTFDARGFIKVKYKNEIYILHELNFDSHEVLDEYGHYICMLNELEKYVEEIDMIPQIQNQQSINQQNNNISDDDFDNF